MNIFACENKNVPVNTGLTTKKLLTFLLILCFGWLVVGAIVNFHQVHVLGQNHPILDHQFIKPKSGDKKTIYLFSKEHKGTDFQDQPHELSVTASNPLTLLIAQEFSYLPVHNDLVVQSQKLSSSLRAPPQA